ncbi:histidine kinase [Streptomyces sp. ME02-8801-2C]|uniref:sensor histidine kinase n=1 Tax=Streptomyces sp. ME02-8801-2C TaxID=3028680 RepID=UPI0029B21DCF|nr:histidine kinase [Streptomyces sp. ME02-8801-2C]MDX3456945.1 histidine kinase [Streptomyces sp. ME02-8801-2C]
MKATRSEGPGQGQGRDRGRVRGYDPTAGYLADDAPAPATLRLQLNALQALCRQTFAVRMTMIALGTPFAMTNTGEGPPLYTVLAAAVLGITASYAMYRDWDRLAPRLLAHPALMAADLVLAAILLLTASPASPLAYATACTPLLAGLLYGWRGSGVFTGLQLVVLLTVYRAWEQRPGTGTSTLLIAGFCVGAGIIGVTLRNLMFRFGTASEALAEANSRLAVAEAVESERARLAREMHDSVTKTLYGLSLAAEALASAADGGTNPNPDSVRRHATLVASAARRAAAESRDLLTDLRHHTDLTAPDIDLVAELAQKAAEFEQATGIRTTLKAPTERIDALPHRTAHHLLAIVSEALENTRRHADAARVTLEAAPSGDGLTLRITDDGVGIPAPLNLEEATRSGHFGVLGMVERARSLGAVMHLGRREGGGTEIRVEVNSPGLPSGLTPGLDYVPRPRKEVVSHARR